MEVGGKIGFAGYIKINKTILLWIPLNLEKKNVKKVLKNNFSNNFEKIKFVDWYEQDNNILYEDFTKVNNITTNILFIINDLKSYLMYKTELKDSDNYHIVLCDFNTSILDLKEVVDIPSVWFSIGEMDININIDLIKHKKHEHDKEFDEKKDPNIYYDHFEGHRNIINQINLYELKI